jgi:dihydrofolate reductase (trimethoprim resistance protein)
MNHDIFYKPLSRPGSEWWLIGTRVRKIKGSQWQGIVVGFYATALTPEGYAVESEAHPGSVQIYPRQALEIAPEPDTPA